MITQKDLDPKTLFFDIETSPVLAALWGGGKQYVNSDQILKDRCVIAISYMWANEKEPTNLRFNLNKHNTKSFDDDSDKAMIKKFIKIYNKAKVVVAHNGRRFDVQRLVARLFKYQLPNIHPVLIDDTYTMCKHIGITSHKLDYISKILDFGRKIETRFSLWIRVWWNKDKKALNEMTEYCGNDVVLLAKIYRAILPYGKSKLNRALLKGDKVCVDCGSDKLQARGYRYTRTQKYRYYSCNNCGSTRTSDKQHSGGVVVK